MTYRGVIMGDTPRGAFGHWLDLAFTHTPHVALAGIADSDPEGLRQAVARTRAERGYTDYRQMLQKERPHLAVVAPHWCDQRKEMVLACVEAGVKGIYLEKPIAPTPAEVDTFLAAADAAGVRVIVNHWRTGGEVQLAKQIIERGEIGQVQMIRGHGKCDERAGGVDLMILGTHVVDAMRFLAGSEVAWVHGGVTQDGHAVTRADAFTGPAGIGRTAGNALTAQFGFAKGMAGSYESFVHKLPTGVNYLGCEIVGSLGILSLRQRQLRHRPHGPWTAEAERVPVPGDWESLDQPAYYQRCHAANINELIAASEADRPVQSNFSTGHDGCAALEIIMATHESHLNGCRINLPLQNRHNPYELGHRN